jgi:RNA polymerase-binding transcription factor DksA
MYLLPGYCDYLILGIRGRIRQGEPLHRTKTPEPWVRDAVVTSIETVGRKLGVFDPPPGSREEEMERRTALRFRRRLLSELGQRGALLGKLKRSIAEQGERYMQSGGAFTNHMAEAATEESDRASDYFLADNQGRAVSEIEEAIRRIDDGNFGSCELCNRPIEPKRLEVIPYARYCLRCQEKAERLANN